MTNSSASKAILASSVVTALLVVLAVPYFFAAMFSVMMFDAPGSTSNPWTWVAFFAVTLYPVLLISLMVAAWVLIARGRHSMAFATAIAGSILATAPVALFLLLVAFD
jgi:hypothetical protein